MLRSDMGRMGMAVVLAAALGGWGGATCVAGGNGRAVASSCTTAPGSGPAVAGIAARGGHAWHADARGGHACGPRACGPPRCGHGPCCPQCCRGHCCHEHCCPGHCCCGHCCHDLCEQIGHCLHHDVYEKRYFLRSQGKSWHSTWYDPAEGRPIALVVPPTAEFQTQYGWGVPSSRVAPIYHQFRRPYPGPGGVAGSGGGFLPTPNLPSDTVQFGVNAVRGPWGSY